MRQDRHGMKTSRDDTAHSLMPMIRGSVGLWALVEPEFWLHEALVGQNGMGLLSYFGSADFRNLFWWGPGSGARM